MSYLRKLVLCILLLSKSAVVCSEFTIADPDVNPTTDFFGIGMNPFCFSCQGQCHLLDDTSILPCKCDDLCVVFGDCCPDYFYLCHFFTAEEALLHFLKTGGKLNLVDRGNSVIQKFVDRAVCTNFHENDKFIKISLLSINWCPSEFGDLDIKSKCEDDELAFPFNIPVSLPTMEFWTFTNVYCAMCHGFQRKEVVFWNAYHECNVDVVDVITSVEQLKTAAVSKKCQTVVFRPPEIQVRKCVDVAPRCPYKPFDNVPDNPSQSANQHNSSMNPENSSHPSKGSQSASQNISLLNSTAETTTAQSNQMPAQSTGSAATALYNLPLLCNSYYRHFVDDNNNDYANAHCYACDHTWKKLKTQDTENCHMLGSSFVHASYHPNSRIVLHHFGQRKQDLYFYSSDTETVLEYENEFCELDQYFDALNDQCVPLHCPEGTIPYFRSCIDEGLGYPSKSTGSYLSKVFVTLNVSLWQHAPFPMLTQIISDKLKLSNIGLVLAGTEGSQKRYPKLFNMTSLSLSTVNYEVTDSKIEGSQIGDSNIVGELEKLMPQSLQIKLNVSIDFQALSITVSDLLQLMDVGNGIRLDVSGIDVRPADERLNCPADRQQTLQNLEAFSYLNHVFTKDDSDLLLDVGMTKFHLTINTTRTLSLESLTTCRQSVVQQNNGLTKLPEILGQHALVCDFVVLDSDYYKATDKTIVLGNGDIIHSEDFLIQANTAQVCVGAILKTRSTIVVAGNTQSKKWFRNITSVAAIVLKLVAFIVNLFVCKLEKNELYFFLLALFSCIPDVLHLLENLVAPVVLETTAISFHFGWLFVAYSSLAWSFNRLHVESTRKLKCLWRHIVISLMVPTIAVVICGTGEYNKPSWNIKYAGTGHIFDVNNQDAILFGYLVPCSFALMGIMVCHVYRMLRLKTNLILGSVFFCHAVITFSMNVQSGFAFADYMTGNDVYYYLYFTFSIITGWTFLFIASQNLYQSPTKLYHYNYGGKTPSYCYKTTQKNEKTPDD